MYNYALVQTYVWVSACQGYWRLVLATHIHLQHCINIGKFGEKAEKKKKRSIKRKQHLELHKSFQVKLNFHC